MAAARPAPPESKPARAASARAAKAAGKKPTRVAKKTVKKKAAKKAVKNTVRKISKKALAAKRDLNVAARSAAKTAPEKAASEKPAPEQAAPETASHESPIIADLGIADPVQEIIIDQPPSPPKRRGVSGKRRSAVERLNDPPPASGLPLLDRVTRAIERELTQIERIVGGHHVKPVERTEAERRARTLASLARTLAEVRKLRAAEEHKRPPDDDAIPRDLDELRRALSRRLKQMVAGAAQLPAAGDE